MLKILKLLLNVFLDVKICFEIVLSCKEMFTIDLNNDIIFNYCVLNIVPRQYKRMSRAFMMDYIIREDSNGGVYGGGGIHSSSSTFQTLLENFGIKSCTAKIFFWFKQISTALLLHP